MELLSKKGVRVVALIRAVRAAGVVQPGGKIRMPGEAPATYIGPAGVEDGIQMHTFRLFDGSEIVLEVPALTAAMQAPKAAAPQLRPAV